MKARKKQKRATVIPSSQLEEFYSFLNNFQKKFNLSQENLLQIISQEKKLIPLQIFKIKALGPLESLVKFLKENQNLTNTKIASLLNRDQRTIWASYQKAKQKQPQKFLIEKETIFLPQDIFANRKLGILESLVKYLKEELNLKYCQIAQLLKRDQRTIWTAYNKK